MQTVDDVVSKHGHTSGFDYMRITLATAVLCIHSFATSYGKSGEAFLFQFPYRGPIMMVLPMFFALSGFLVTGSYFRTNNIGVFVLFRVLRLVPALAVEVVLSAVILGSIFTTLPLQQYFTDHLFFTYFFNIAGRIHFLLPGVFDTNPFASVVNISLWTLPFELECYMALILVAITMLFRVRAALLALVVVLNILLFISDYLNQSELPMDGALPGRLLVICFLYGVIIYAFKEHVPFSRKLAFGAFLVSLASLYFLKGEYLAPLPIAYLTAFIGLCRFPSSRITSGDYSYGVYLYAWPIRQSYSYLFPSMREWYLNIIFCLPVTVIFALFSWYCVEKHVLKLRRPILAVKWPKIPTMKSIANRSSANR